MIKKGSRVKVLIGKDKKKEGEVIEIDRPNNRAKVKGLNLVKKHMKTTKEKKGGIITKENYINISNLVIMETKKITKKEKKITIKYFDDKIRSTSTFDLLYYLKKKIKANLFFLIGADNLKKFHKWKNWRKIPKLAKIVVFPRGNYSFASVATKKLSKNDFVYIKSKKINISSSIIRKFW